MKKFRAVYEFNFDSLFENKKSQIEELIEKNFKYKEPNIFSKLIFRISTWHWFVLSMCLIFPSIFLLIRIIIEKRLNKKVAKALDPFPIFQDIIKPFDNIKLQEMLPSSSLDSETWEKSNLISERPIHGVRLKNKSNVLSGSLNNKNFKIGIATWIYYTYVTYTDHEGNKQTSELKHTEYSSILEIKNLNINISDKVSISAGKKSEEDLGLENADFNKNYFFYSKNDIDKRKIFTLATQESWVELAASLWDTYASIKKDSYIQAVKGLNISSTLFVLDADYAKKLDKESIQKSIFEDIYQDIFTILYLLSFPGSSTIITS